MKFVLPLFIFVLLLSCSNSNDFTTQLLNEKKQTEDSIKLSADLERQYMARSKQEIQNGSDSTVWLSLADSSGYYYRKGLGLKEKLKSIEFSLDSLSRMK